MIINSICGKGVKCLDNLHKVTPLCETVKDWKGFLSSGISEKEMEELRKHERTGRPLGNEGFVKKLERTLSRLLRKQKPGRKKGDERN